MDRGISMESIINITEGVKPSESHRCFFCDQEAPFHFGIVNSKKKVVIGENTNGYVMSSVALCSVHAEAFNSLLSGEHDVNELISVMKTTKSKKLNLRRR